VAGKVFNVMGLKYFSNSSFSQFDRLTRTRFQDSGESKVDQNEISIVFYFSKLSVTDRSEVKATNTKQSS
jgi:hypothetical protein